LTTETHHIWLPYKTKVIQLLLLCLRELPSLGCFPDVTDPTLQALGVSSSSRHVAVAVLLLPFNQLLQPLLVPAAAAAAATPAAAPAVAAFRAVAVVTFVSWLTA
jgi:hypothetical protein